MNQYEAINWKEQRAKAESQNTLWLMGMRYAEQQEKQAAVEKLNEARRQAIDLRASLLFFKALSGGLLVALVSVLVL